MVRLRGRGLDRLLDRQLSATAAPGGEFAATLVVIGAVIAPS